MIFLVLMVHWLDVSPDANYQFVEFYSGSGRLTQLAGKVGYPSVAYDMTYGEILAQQNYKRSAMDINSNAGLVFLALQL